MNGARLLVEALKEEGIRHIFGYPGVSICPFFDALKDSKIEAVLMRGEQACGHAANGYARITNAPGVCAVSSGPGATNLITAIATAFADSIPLVCITGQVPTEQIGSDMFQEADIIGACESFVKYSYQVRTAKDIPRIVKEAFYIAGTGRKGPVLIDLPIDVQFMEGGQFAPVKEVNLRTYKPTIKGHAVQIKKALKALDGAKKPILCIGGGVFSSNASKEIITFAEKYKLPIVSTMMGLSAVPTQHPLYVGMVGNNGKKYANKAMNESDVLLMVGARVADRAISQPDLVMKDKVLIHIDIDPAEIGKNVGPSIPIVGDAKSIFEELNKADLNCDFTAWKDNLDRFAKTREKESQKTAKFVDPNHLVKAICSHLKKNSVYIADVGQNQIYSCSNYSSKSGRFFTTGGMGTMGYALPAAIGASLANPKADIICALGDGGMQMSMQDLANLSVLKSNVKIVLMDNRCLGMIKEYQHYHFDNRYQMVDLDEIPDYSHIAKAYGIPYVKIRKDADVEKKIAEIFETKGPVFVEADIDSEAFTVG